MIPSPFAHLPPMTDDEVARVLKVGRTLCPLAAELHDDDGRLIAHAGMTYMRVRRDSGARDSTGGQGGTR